MFSANKRNKYIFILSVALNVLTVCFFVGKRVYYGYQGYKQSHPYISPDSLKKLEKIKNKYNINCEGIFKSLQHDTTDIVFLGTSLTQGFPLQEIFNNCRLKNRGVSGNTTNDILNRLDEVVSGRPAKVFLEIGINDLIQKISVDSTYYNIKEIITRIKKQSPKTKIYLQSAIPSDKSGNTQSLNALTKTYCLAHGITYINLYPAFDNNGLLKQQLTVDGTHLTAQGYQLWKTEIIRFINE
jgi:hypothetical protein